MSRLDEIRDVIRDGMLLEHEEARYLLALTDKLLAALIPMVDRWEPDTDGADRRMWEAARAAIEEAKK